MYICTTYVKPSDILHFQSISSKLIHRMNSELKIYGNKINGTKRAVGKGKGSQKIQNVDGYQCIYRRNESLPSMGKHVLPNASALIHRK